MKRTKLTTTKLGSTLGMAALVLAVTAVWWAPAPETAAQDSGGMTLEGRLIAIAVDQFPDPDAPPVPEPTRLDPGAPDCAVVHFLQTDTLTRYELADFESTIVAWDQATISSGDRIRVSNAQLVTETMANGQDRYELHSGTVERLAPAQAMSNNGVQQVAVVLVNFIDETATPWGNGFIENLYFTAPDSARFWLEEFSYGRTSIMGQVFGDGNDYYTIPVTAPQTFSECEAIDDPGVAAVDPDIVFIDAQGNQTFDRIVFVFPGVGCGFSGFSTFSPRTFLTNEGEVELQVNWINGLPFRKSLIVHEQGHHYGMGHGNSWLCPVGAYSGPGCASTEYGNWNDVMGGYLGHPNAKLKRTAGWLDSQNFRTVTQDGVYTIAPLEDSTSAVQALVVQDYYIEYRTETSGFIYGPTLVDDRDGPAVNINQGRLGVGAPARLLRYPHLDSPAPGNLKTWEEVVDLARRVKITPVAETSQGMDVEVKFLTVPGVPRNLTADGGNGTITLSWDPPLDDGGIPITSYVYSIRHGGSQSWSTTSTSASRGGFSNGITYYAKVEACNDLGCGPETSEVPVTPSQIELDLVATPYYGSGYRVGLRAEWNAIPGAVSYRVTHFRQDACGQATVVVNTAGTASGSGKHVNCGAPDECYYKRAKVEALSAQGNVIKNETRSFCRVGRP